MIAMQYGFTLPADYDMSIIERRVQEKGYLFDDIPDLVFKAFLVARKDDKAIGSRENLYAPFYLWKTAASMEDFLCGEKFRAPVASFGWPAVRVWIPVASAHGLAFDNARFASRELGHLEPHTNLDEFRREEALASEEAVRSGAVYALSAFEPTTWTYVRFRLWPEAPHETDNAMGQIYRVHHLSLPDGGASFQ